jgi:hypothetical protein
MLGRPHTVAPLVRSLRENTPEPHRAVFVCSPDDGAVHEAVRAEGLQPLVIPDPPGRGDYARKIQAGIDATGDPLLFLAACDLQFHYRWLSRAIAKLTRGVGVVGTNDLGNPRVMAGQHATHCLVTRAYTKRGLIDGGKGLLFDGYQHEYVDDELIGTARSRNALAFATDSHVEHMHPSWGKAPSDPMYDRQRLRMRADRTLFLKRRKLWT